MLKYVNTGFLEAFYKNWLSNIEMPGGIKNPLGVDGGWQQASNFLRTFMENENPFFSSFSSNKITDQMSQMFGMLQGALGQNGGPFSTIMSGYQGYFSKLVESSTAQAAEKLAEGFDTWSKEMEKNLMAPKLGINRELASEISKALVLSKDYMSVFSKMARLVDTTSRKAGARFQAKLSEAALNNKPVNKFADFCALWAVENETVFLDVMGTQEFAKLQGDFVDAGHRLKIQWNKLAEKALEPTPIALKRDLDLAIAEIHQMKRDMRIFQREIREMKADAQLAHKAQAVAEEEAKKAKVALKAAEAAAQEEAKKAKAALKAAEAAAQVQAKKAKAAEVAAEVLAKKTVTTVKTATASPKATTKTKSKNA